MSTHRLAAGRLAPERTAARLARPLRRFVETEVSSGVVLLAAVVAALAWANSPWKETYVALWSTEIHVAIGPFGHSATIEAAVNDGLMALFFFVVGLEVKSELIRGHLRKPRRAAMPAIAALFGMAVPVAIYLAINSGGPAARGWGVPIATDIALALGVLSLAGRVPEELRVLLLGIAIIDDIGAVLVIALAYTREIDPTAVGIALALLAVIVGLRRIEAWWTPAYVLVGCAVWLAVYLSGVHATIAGVALGLLTPVKPLRPGALRRGAGNIAHDGEVAVLQTRMIRLRAIAAAPLADRLMNLIHPWTSFVVLPLFALVNAGIVLDRGSLVQAAESSAALGIAVALVAGKIVGIVGGCWIARRFGARLPDGVGWRDVAGIAALGGVGFTMSLFIAGLAFRDDTLHEAKIAVLVASAVSALVGLVLLRRAGPAHHAINDADGREGRRERVGRG